MKLDPPVIDALRQFTAFLAGRKIAWALLGGIAVRVLAMPRNTFDVDLIIAVEDGDVGTVASAADEAGFDVDDAFRRGYCDQLAGQSKFHVHAQIGTRLVRIDVFVLGSEFERCVFQRRTSHETELGTLWIVSPEDLMLLKLLADRPRDRADVADLLLVIGALDMDYVRAWANRLGITDRLDGALRDAGRTS